MSFQKFSALCGITGCLIILGCAFATAWNYEGIDCEPYSMLNHFISELGDRRISSHSWVFNGGMMVSSLMLILFSMGLMRIQQGWPRFIIGPLGLVTAIACGFVGYFPEDILQPHLIAAMIFFHSALAMVLLCSVLSLLGKKAALPKWTVIPGVLTAIIFASFVFWPSDLVQAWIRDPAHFIRPPFWWHTVLEWACFFSIICWILAVAVVVGRKVMQEERASETK